MSPLKSQQLFFFLLVSFLPIVTFGLEPILYQFCEKNFTKNVVLEFNINNIVFDMAIMASHHHFAISSFGVGSDAVYGVSRCQEDMRHIECLICITDIAQKILNACPDSAKARVWHEKCFLRYDTENFIGKLDQSYASVWLSAQIAENPEVFEHGVAELMAKVMATAAGERRKFSSGEAFLKESGKMTVHGMAQCTRDLEETACNQCLENSMEIMTKYCGCHLGCRIFGSSCVLRYEIYKFLYDTGNEALAPAPNAIGY